MLFCLGDLVWERSPRGRCSRSAEVAGCFVQTATFLFFMFMSHFSAEKCVAVGSGARVSLAILFWFAGYVCFGFCVNGFAYRLFVSVVVFCGFC
jgi:hypothetical protein